MFIDYKDFYESYQELKKLSFRDSFSLNDLVNKIGLELNHVLKKNVFGEKYLIVYLLDKERNKELVIGHCLLENNCLKDIVTINYLEQGLIKGVGRYIFELFLIELTKGHNKVFIKNVLESSRGFWEKMIDEYKQKGYIKAVKFVKSKYRKYIRIAYDFIEIHKR